MTDSNPAVDAVMDRVDVDHLVDRLTGRNGGLRPSKPTAAGDDGLTQFVWRMARFHSGHDPKMPVTAHWWLSSWMDDHGIDASVSGIMDDDGKDVTSALDDVVDNVLDELGESKFGAVAAWGPALGL